MNNKKTITIWFAVNKNGFIGLYSNEPTRNNETGKWESKYPFVNSIIYQNIKNMIESSNFDWNQEPQCLTYEIDIEQYI